MLKERDIDDIAHAAASTTLTSDTIISVTSSPMVDSVGDPALRITITVTPESTKAITGKDALRTLAEIQRRLQEQGEDRFPIVEYATSKESECAGS
jgi:hypothetical protein